MAVLAIESTTFEKDDGSKLLSAIITPELWSRKTRSPDAASEMAALRRLADTMADDPKNIFQVCADLVLELCQADSCGISLRERTKEGEDIFRWVALAGQLKQHLHRTAPRYSSPFALCVDSNEPLLMRRPELVHKNFDVGLPFHDVLLIPLVENRRKLEGTIWIVAHSPQRKFDAEDARAMQRIAVFIVAAAHLASIAEEAKSEASEQALLVRELDHRFNNALTMTAGLINLQTRTIADPAARAAMRAASGRVVALGLVHQICSHAPTGDLAEVVKSVCTNLADTDPRIDLEVDVESVIAPTRKATVIALISNELITNAMKHAFRDRDMGRIAVSLRRTAGNSVTLSVADDGEPMAMDVQKRPNGIGLDLITRLAAQLAGEFRVDADPKRFSVVFPEPAGQS